MSNSTFRPSAGGLPTRIVNWRVDSDGMLRVTAHVVKEGVFAYSASETGCVAGLAGVDPVLQGVLRTAFTAEALASLEGKPVTVPLREPGQDWHQWRDTGNTLADGLTVGAMAGKPRVTEDGALACDMLIFDLDAIRQIQRGELVEVSAGYDGVLVPEQGELNGQPYHALQTNLRFNHVLLLPQGMGRCGRDVRIINSQPGKGERNMPASASLQVVIGKKSKTYRFSNELDAAKAGAMLEEEQTCNAEQAATEAEEKKALAERMLRLESDLVESRTELEKAQVRIKELEAKAEREREAAKEEQQQEEEEALARAEVGAAPGDPAGEQRVARQKEAFNNAARNCGTLSERRAAIAGHLLQSRGKDTASWSRESLEAAFETLVLAAEQLLELHTARHPDMDRLLNGRQPTFNSSGNNSGNNSGSYPGARYAPGGARHHLSNRDRMLQPMRALNARPGAAGQQ